MSDRKPTAIEAAAHREEARRLGIASASITMLDALDVSAIFFMIGNASLKVLFEEIARYIMLPFAAAGNLIVAIFSWRIAALNNYQASYVAKALVETIGALAIAAAVVGAFLFSSVFTLAGPLLFAGMFALRTLYNIASIFSHGIQYLRENDPDKKQDHLDNMRNATIATVVGLVMSTAVVGVMIFAKPVLAFVGMVGGLLGASLAMLKIIELAVRGKAKPQETPYINNSSLIIESTLQKNPASPSKKMVAAPEAMKTNDGVVELKSAKQKEEAEARSVMGLR